MVVRLFLAPFIAWGVLSMSAGLGLAQWPADSYQSGPDPIAPSLPAPNVSPEARAAETPNNGDTKDDPLDMLDMPLEQLSKVAVTSPSMEMEVSTVSRTESTVGKTPAAVYVITNEMIRRSGARNLPEALRLAPGVQVAQVTNTTWAISIRGYNATFSNKLLVQIDGRAVYTPGFGGVSWDQNYVLLEDVDRIEVVRGPGGSVWGANAVNGVINIVTKSAADTQGIYAHGGGGSEHRSFNAVRYGSQAGDLHWRVYGMQAEDSAAWRDPGQWWLPPGAWDAFRYGQGGFRMDWTPNRHDTLTLQGDFLSQRETLQMLDNLFFYTRSPEAVYSNNFVARWTRKIDDDRDWSVQMYYDGFKRQATGSTSRLIVVNTFDFDSQYHFKMGERHDVVCGLGYRNYASTMEVMNGVIDFDPTRDAFSTISWFVQDTVALSPDRLYLTGGIKLEENNFTGFEFQPSVRLLVTPDDRTSIWGAISRAVRTPSISERDIDIFGGFVRGNQNLVAEDLMAYELGIRRQPTDKLYWDLAVFYNHYNKLIGSYPVTEFTSIAANVGAGDSYGYELVVTYEVNPDWRLSTGYSFLVENVAYGPVGTAFYAGPGYNPRNQCYLHSAWNLSKSTHLDMIWRYVDSLAVGVPHYLVMDVRLAWEPRRGLEFAVVGQNLLEKHHLEFYDFNGSTEVPAGVYGMVTWRH